MGKQIRDVMDTLTYEQLWRQSGLVVELLLNNGVQRGDRVMIAYPFGLEFLSGLYGCMRLGAIACSVYPPNILDINRAKHSFAQFNAQVADADAKVALTTAQFKRALRLASFRYPKITRTVVQWLPTDNISSAKPSKALLEGLDLIKPETIAFIQYSSGSTGSPKGVVIDHQAIVYHLQSNFGRVGSGVGVTWMPQYHDFSLIIFFLLSCYSPKLVVYASSPLDFIKNPLLWIDMLDNFKATFTGGPNFAYSLLAKRMGRAERKLKCSTLKLACVGAEPVSLKTLEQMEKIGIPKSAISPCYGLAEVCCTATGCSGDEIRVVDGVVSVGLLAHSEAIGKFTRIATSDGRIVADGEIGEVSIRGPDVASRYWNKPELDHCFHTRLSDGHEYCVTGDLGKIVDGRLYVVGRAKELIIVNGKNIYPTDIERAIEDEYPSIVRPGSTVAFQRTEDDIGVALEIRKTVKKWDLVDHKFSAKLVRQLVMDSDGVKLGRFAALKQGTIPKTTSGKLKRVETRKRFIANDWNRSDVLINWTTGKDPTEIQTLPPKRGPASTVPPPLVHSTLVGALKHNARSFPDQIFVNWVNDKCDIIDTLTYGQLFDKSGLVVNLLAKKGIQAGDRVMIAYPFGLDFLGGLFGCMRFGAIPCSVYPPNFVDNAKAKHSVAQFNRQVEDAGATLALTTANYKRKLFAASLIGPKTAVQWVATDNLKVSSNNPITMAVESLDKIAPESTAFIQYSSGSTGEPKGIVISHRAVTHNIGCQLSDMDVVAGSVGVTWMPQYHDYALVGNYLLASVSPSAALFACSPVDFIRNPLLWADMIDKFDATLTAAPNFAYSLLAKRMKAADRKLSSNTALMRANIAAEPISPKTLEAMADIGISRAAINPSYGMAETCVRATSAVGDEVRVIDGVVSSGYLPRSAAYEMDVCVATPDGVLAGEGEVGEIFLCGPDLASSYWNKPDLDHLFRVELSNGKAYFASGDLGKIIDNRLYVVGRSKELIIVNGRNIYPTDIERIVESEFPDILRPGSTVAFQGSESDVGLIVEIRKSFGPLESQSAAFSVDAVRSLVFDACNVDLGQMIALKQGTVPKTTSGKLRRLETRQRCVDGDWKPDDIMLAWTLDSFARLGAMRRSNLSASHGAAELSIKGNVGTSPDPGARYGTGCPMDRAGGLVKFFARQGTKPYSHGSLTEHAVLDYDAILSELDAMEERLEEGIIRRDFGITKVLCINPSFWTSVPSVPPLKLGLGQDVTFHKIFRPWVDSVLEGLPGLDVLRADVGSFIDGCNGTLSTNDIHSWVILTFFRLLASKELSLSEVEEFKLFQGAVFDIFSRPYDVSGDKDVLLLKSRYLHDFVDRLGLDLDLASALLDLMIAQGMQTVVAIRCSLAMSCCDTGMNDNAGDGRIFENNVLQHVWECLRLFPIQEAMAWMEGDERKLIAMGITGRDKAIWGDDVDAFRPDRCNVDAFESRSCFFAEQARSYQCPGKEFLLALVSAVTLEVSQRRWSRPTVRPTAKPPYFDDFELRRFPKVVIVGGGVAGLVSALRLAQGGLQVTVVEKNEQVGGHARYAEVLGGHLRNPAFGVFTKGNWPNLASLVEELGVEEVRCCSLSDHRRNFAFDGHKIPEPDPIESTRFLSEMRLIYENGQETNTTIGEYFDSHGYDDEFITYFFIGKAITFFGGLSIQQYLEIPLNLMAWFVSAQAVGDKDVYRLRNKDYMESFVGSLEELGVRLITNTSASLLSRDAYGVRIRLGRENNEILVADRLVLAMPPNAASKFLGNHMEGHENVLVDFECPLETVAFHQDSKWVDESSRSVYHARFPDKGASLPKRLDTIPVTGSILSDSDGQTPIYATYSYANVEDLDIDGPISYMSFTHVRITPKTVRLREALLEHQGAKNTYFAGGWCRGFMLHDDALVSGTEVANSILSSCGKPTHPVRKRRFDIPTKDVEPGSKISGREPLGKGGVTKEHVSKVVLSIIEEECAIEVGSEDTLGSLGLASVDIASIHSAVQDKFNLDEDRFPLVLFFDGETRLAEIITAVWREASFGPRSADAYVSRSATNDVLSIFERECGQRPAPSDGLASLRLTSIKIASIHASIIDAFRIPDDAFPVSTFFESGATVNDVVRTVASVSSDNHQGQPRPRLDGEPVNAVAEHQGTQPNNFKRTVFVSPLPVAAFGCFLQLLGLLIPPIYLAMSIVPLGLLVLPLPLQFAALLAPVGALLYAVTSAILLIVVKWVVLGKLRPDHTAVWSVTFAKRWIVRQCCRTCFLYTPWRFMNKTEAMSILQRSLGCKLGQGSFINHECIDDFDLVSVGNNSTVEGFVNPADVSVGVVSFAPVRIGSNCKLEHDCLVEMGSTIEEGVQVAPRCLITPDSLLPTNSRWEGTPARRIDDDDVENRTSERSSVQHHASGVWYTVIQYVTLLVLSPYLLVVEYFVSYVVGLFLYENLGWIGLAVLVWVPPTCSFGLAWTVTLAAKKCLLGVVCAGRWPLYGIFHRRKYFVDHLVSAHLVVWRDICSLLGSPLGASVYVRQMVWRSLGGKVGHHSLLSTYMSWTDYDLVQIGNYNSWGGGSFCLPWRVEAGHLIGEAIRSRDNCFVGANGMVMGGVTLEQGATVAAFSVASRDVAGNETVVGVRNHRVTLESNEDGVNDYWTIALGSHLCGLLMWLFASGTTGVGFGVLAGSIPSYGQLSLWGIWCAGVGLTLCLLVPLYGALLCVAAKYVFTGTFRAQEIKRGSSASILFWAELSFSVVKDKIARPFLGGTFLEILFYTVLGVKFGINVFLDSVTIYEPDLVEIGDHTSLGFYSVLVPHTVMRTTIQRAELKIGERCSIGYDAMVHGRDELQDDTTLSGKSMGLIGSRLSAGHWAGYPARRLGASSIFQPKRPSVPAWYVLLKNPMSAIFGLFWWGVLSLYSLVCFHRKLDFNQQGGLSKNPSNSPERLPRRFAGIFEAASLPLSLRLDCGRWTQSLRKLQLSAGTFIKADERFKGKAWCWWAGYELSFNSQHTEATGQVCFGGWWRVPRSIVQLHLRFEGDDDDLLAGLSWFMGDPKEEIRFKRHTL